MAIIGAAMEVRYREICRRLIARQTPKQIAEEMQMSPGTLYTHLRKESFRDMLRELDKEIFAEIDEMLGAQTTDINQRIASVQNEAFDQLVHVMRYGAKESSKIKASTEILDRGGTGARQAPVQQVSSLSPIAAKMLVLAMFESIEAEKPSTVITIEAEAKSA